MAAPAATPAPVAVAQVVWPEPGAGPDRLQLVGQRPVSRGLSAWADYPIRCCHTDRSARPAGPGGLLASARRNARLHGLLGGVPAGVCQPGRPDLCGAPALPSRFALHAAR